MLRKRVDFARTPSHLCPIQCRSFPFLSPFLSPFFSPSLLPSYLPLTLPFLPFLSSLSICQFLTTPSFSSLPLPCSPQLHSISHSILYLPSPPLPYLHHTYTCTYTHTYTQYQFSGMAMSRIFVPLISRESVKSRLKSRNNFESLKESSSCDNVLLGKFSTAYTEYF